MPTGSILDKFSNKGFTFIAVDPEHEIDENVFLHVSAVEDQNQTNLFVRGSRVEFEVVYVSRDGRDRPQARNARLVVEAASAVTSTSSADRRCGSVKFWHPMGYGFIVDEKGDHEYYVKTASVPGGYLREGDIAAFDVESADDGRTQAVNVKILHWDPVGDPYCDLIDMGHPRWANVIKELAEDEKWNYQFHPAKDPFVILKLSKVYLSAVE